MMMKTVKNGFNYSKMEFGKNKTKYITISNKCPMGAGHPTTFLVVLC